VQVVGPSLAGVRARAEAVVKSPDYKGTAKTPEEYIRESILNPNAYIVPGPTFSAAGQSLMPAIYQSMLTADDIEHLVAYVATIK
jgi:nitric oxide reductase subunit C